MYVLHFPQYIQRFATEFEALSKCNHPNIVNYVHHVIESDGSDTHLYIVMEYIPQVE